MSKQPVKNPPKTIETESLGTLKLCGVRPDKVEYSVTHVLGGMSVELTLLSAEKSQEMEATIGFASKLVKEFTSVKRRLDKYVTQTVVKKVNANLGNNDPITPAMFLTQLELKLVDIHATGKASFWYSPLEVLRGHALVLYGTAEGSIDDFDTPG